MRDLTPELKERLADTESRLSVARANVKELEKEAEATRVMLEFEMRRQGLAGESRSSPKKAIGDIVSEALRNGPITKDELGALAEAQGHGAPGRAIHAVLMGLQRHGHVIRESDEHYVFTKRGMEASIFD
jgi:hypothetical protein